MDVKKIIICPKCRCSLDEKLFCKKCNTQYSEYYGVYDIVNSELSSNQKILWNISDQEIATFYNPYFFEDLNKTPNTIIYRYSIPSKNKQEII